MTRIVLAIAAWATGTAIAVGVAWFGANVVLADAGVGSGVPVVNAAPPTVKAPATALSSAAAITASPPPSTAPVKTPAAAKTPEPTKPTKPTKTPKPSASASPSPSPTGTLHDYALTGGHVTLDLTATTVTLVSAIPDTGYSVQTWNGTGWLRVDFSSGPQVSSLIASWFEHAPTVTVEN